MNDTEPATNEEWKKWGETDPLFGVASWPGKHKDGARPWTSHEFYALGASDWRNFRARWERYGLNPESCLEVGCGAGRITMQLAKTFARVYAIDVSEKMIEYATRHIVSESVMFQISNGRTIPLGRHTVSGVFSSHVFQHFDSLSVAESYFAEIGRVLKPGGTIMIHLPVYRWPTQSKGIRQLYAIHSGVKRIRTRIKRRLMRYGLVKPMLTGIMYPMEFVYDTLPRHDFGDIEIAIFVTTSNNDPHPFVFAKKNHGTAT